MLFIVLSFLLFLSTPSARRATFGGVAYCRDCQNFYPRPPRGGRHDQKQAANKRPQFLSTPSARRATTIGSEAWLKVVFLSTPSARRATSPARAGAHDRRFLSTPSARRATFCTPPARRLQYDFYPRPPRGGRPRAPTLPPTPRNFYPRPPRGGRPRSSRCCASTQQFLSTPSARRATSASTMRWTR